MNVAGALAVFLVNRLRRSGALSLKTVEDWIADHSNRESYGAGYGGNRLNRGPKRGYAEVLREKRASTGRSKITATVYLDPRQGAVASKTWEASKLDSELEKFFGRNLRVRIDV